MILQAAMPDFRDAKQALLVALGIFGVIYIVALGMGLARLRRPAKLGEPPSDYEKPSLLGLGVGFITNFFDTLGIGSYATTTSLFRFFRMVPDERIPGTLNVGHTIPTIIEAFIFTRIVPVDARTLILMIAASVVGAWLGAGVVARWPRRKVQIGMGLALLAAAGLMLMTALSVGPAGGSALSLEGPRLWVGSGINFVLGALMTLGIGLYAPSMITVSLLGMDPKAAFPIMMGSCAFLMPVASARFIKERSFDPKASLGLMIGGIPAVLAAAFIVKSLPLTYVRWLVVVVVVYTSVTLLMAANREKAKA